MSMRSAKRPVSAAAAAGQFVLLFSIWVLSGWWHSRMQGDAQDATLHRELTAEDFADVSPCVRDRLERALAEVDARPLRGVELESARAVCEGKQRVDAQRAALGESGADAAK